MSDPKFKPGDKVEIRTFARPEDKGSIGTVLCAHPRLPGEYIVKSDEFEILGMFNESDMRLAS